MNPLTGLVSLVQNIAAVDPACAKGSFLGISFHWYQYLNVVREPRTGRCQITNFKVPNDFLLVGLAVVDILLRFAGLVAIGFIIYGGIQYVLSQGQPDRTKAAQDTIINALAGLVIAIAGAGIISFIGNRLG